MNLKMKYISGDEWRIGLPVFSIQEADNFYSQGLSSLNPILGERLSVSKRSMNFQFWEQS